ncbi:hypothetical protein ACETAC_07720 [Aceticella autotrophica]|uniref:Putative heavy-metal chelation domain-containing protein n=1 Tax=Aceticella autotrophica TaxID=2755338 RepID=A0A975AUP8_9THEO|nr:DUF364 domain-containing protein [Aceticella autotrophica]QSZ26773.1 hypothetical protein ACETAC_07720 [Aceticella autotrophica]
MSYEIIKRTIDELRALDAKGKLSDVMVTRSTRLFTPWTFSYVICEDGYVGCGMGNNGFDVPIDLSFLKEVINLDAYEVLNRLEQGNMRMFDISLIISIIAALSHKFIWDENTLKVYGFDAKTLSKPALSAILDLGLIDRKDVVAFVGYFYGFVAHISTFVKEVDILELEPIGDFEIYKAKPENTNVRVFPSSKSKEVLENADVVILTGMTIANDTVLPLLEFTKNARFVMMMGPTNTFYPKALFDEGVDLIGAILFPSGEQFKKRFINSRGYWYDEMDLKHMLICPKGRLEKIKL